MNTTKAPSQVATPPPQTFAMADEVGDAIRRRSASVHARLRVAEAIYALALDICGDEDALSAQDRTWLHRAIAGPVSEATEEALRTLTNEMALALRSAPTAVRPSMRAVPIITRTDFE